MFLFGVLCAVQECHVTKTSIAETKKVSTEDYSGEQGCHLFLKNENIILDAVTNTRCHVRCQLGYFETTVGEKNPLFCAPRSENRTREDGITTEPLQCKGMCDFDTSIIRPLNISRFGSIWRLHTTVVL